MPRHPLTSSTAACCWIPLFALRCEEGRRPELASQPAALLAPDIARRLWQVSPLGRHAGVKPGMTVSQAIGLCPSLRLCEPDPVYYDEQFARLLAALSAVSPVVEPAELGRAYVGTDGLEGLYGAPEGIVEEMQLRIVDCGLRIGNTGVESAIRNPQSAIRVGWGRGKFVSWVAATRAKPGGAIIVRPGEEGKFLSAQPRRSRTRPPTGIASPRRSGPGSSRRRPSGQWSGSRSSSPPSRLAPPNCSSSPATRAPPRGRDGGARSALPCRRSNSGSSARCSTTSSRCSHGRGFRSGGMR